jgi:hypothetical protein
MNDNMICDFCKEIGLKLLPVSEGQLPIFKLDLRSINYALMISKAMYLSVKNDPIELLKYGETAYQRNKRKGEEPEETGSELEEKFKPDKENEIKIVNDGPLK